MPLSKRNQDCALQNKRKNIFPSFAGAQAGHRGLIRAATGGRPYDACPPRALGFNMIMRLLLSVLILFPLVAVSPVRAGDLRMVKQHGTSVVEIAINRNPPIVGDNRIEISITDGNGRRVSEAQILVNYYMPPMPRMAPMNYTTPAKLKGDTYQTTMHLIMDGPWIIALKITQGGKRSTVKFHINAR